MKQTLPYQKVGFYDTSKHTLLSLLNDFCSKDYHYGLMTNRHGDILGYFTSKQLLHYCHQVGFVHVEDIEMLRPFLKMLHTNFDCIQEEELSNLSFQHETSLYIVKRGREVMGVIDREMHLSAVVEKQQYELHHFKTMFNAVPNGIIAVDIEGIITMINPAAEKLSGVRKEQALGRFITEVVPPDGLLRVLQSGQGHVEKYKVRKWWYISYREPIYDGKRLVGAVGVFSDISKMEMLSSELEAFKHLVKENEALMEQSDHGIAIIDVKGNIVRQNRQFRQLYLSIVDDMKQRMELFQAIEDVTQKQLTSNELEMRTEKGKIYRFQFTSMLEDLILKNVIIRVIDISREKNLEVVAKRIMETHKSLFQINGHYKFIAHHEEMKELTKKIKKIAKVSVPVLIKGEMGTGRSLVAKQIVAESERKSSPFLEIECYGKSYDELKNFFMIQDHQSSHVLHAASGGTLYLKNIDYLPLALQEQFASLIVEHGSEKTQKQNKIDVRIIASISKEPTFKGPSEFSERLYYLLNAIILQLPTLEERLYDVRLIIENFIEKLEEKYQFPIAITEEAIEFLTKQKWKRNLKEIFEILEQYIVHFPQNIIDHDQLVLFLSNGENELKKIVNVNRVIPLKQAVAEVEKELIQHVSLQNISYRKIAKILEVNPSTIVRKVGNFNKV